MKRQPVIVEWHDAHADASDWSKLDELTSAPRLIVSCGFLLSRAKAGHVTIAQSFDGEYKRLAEVLHIPRGMVQSITRL